MSFICEYNSCGQRLKIPDHLAGTKVKCPKCAGFFTASALINAAPAESPIPVQATYQTEPRRQFERVDDDEPDDRPARRRSRADGATMAKKIRDKARCY